MNQGRVSVRSGRHVAAALLLLGTAAFGAAFGTVAVSATVAGPQSPQAPPAEAAKAGAATLDARPAPPAEFTKLCVRCHPSDKIVEGRRYPAQWEQVLEQMVARGATGTEPEFDAVYDYLVAQFGRVAINTAPADEIAQVLHLDAGVAEAIVQQRTASGKFADFAALTAVPGVPAAALEKLRDAIVF